MTILNKTTVVFFILLALFVTGCGDQSVQTPEMRLQHWLTQMETAVKAKKLSDIKALMSSDYQDAQGNTRQKIMLQLTLWFKRYDTIGLSNRITEMAVMGETARLVVETTFSESPTFAHMGLSKNTYQFVLLFEAEGDDWLLNNLSYHRQDR